jgi:hypothetical protein
MVTHIDTNYINKESAEREYAGWVLFRDESLDVSLRVAIFQQIFKIDIQTMILDLNFRPKQIEVDVYKHCLICGEKAFNKLQGR